MAILTAYWSLDSVVFTIALFIAAYLYTTRKFLYWKKRGVMEISPTPFVGNFADCLLMKRSPGEFVRDLYNRSANLPYMGFYIFDRPFFMVRDPELMKIILLRDFNYFSDRFASAHDSVSETNIFFLNNPGWKLLRTKLTPTFTSGKLKKLFELMLRIGENMKKHLNSLDLKEGQVMDFKSFSARFSTDATGAAVFGLDVNSLENPDAEFRRHGLEIFQMDFWRSIEVTSIFYAPHFAKLLGFKFLPDKSSKFLRRTFWDTVAERQQSGIRRCDLVDRLMDLRKSELDSPDKNIFDFDGDCLVAQTSAFFNGGYETVSSAVSFTVYELALAPNIQTKLRNEIKVALENNNDELTYDLMMNIPYLEMVISETLRKYASLPFLDRVTNADYQVPNSNLVLEKGTPVYIPVSALHNDPEYFPNPHVFDPERFNEENNRNRKNGVYMPFGEGPRMCIGKRFALLEIKIAIINILSEYEVLPCEKTTIPMKLDPKALFTTSEGGNFLKIRKISPWTVDKDAEK